MGRRVYTYTVGRRVHTQCALRKFNVYELALRRLRADSVTCESRRHFGDTGHDLEMIWDRSEILIKIDNIILCRPDSKSMNCLIGAWYVLQVRQTRFWEFAEFEGFEGFSGMGLNLVRSFPKLVPTLETPFWEIPSTCFRTIGPYKHLAPQDSIKQGAFFVLFH